ncbi:cyanophycinase [Noviherbaspirillum cavernae]|uniref:Cyanophycinase n=1 Tax=Noviherbaspirillum cavernae TaxID=2320862 RepID=A0A418X4S5_9BURK|nr:cyanophycinase [Noviherbaspirillum cavernae]RJG07381.1 cyanophycinase [Noviherbaspirillum cavernae]
MKRRNILIAGIGALGCWRLAAHAAAVTHQEAVRIVPPSVPPSAPPSASPQHRQGRLVIIGGAEDRTGDKLILRRFVELTGRDDPQIAVLTAASAFPDFAWGRYDQVLTEIGVRRRVYLAINTPDDCNDPALAAQIVQSDGVFIGGGDQRRLVSLIGGTEIEKAIRYAYLARGACIAGTSAGAAAMSRHMLAGRGVSDGMGLLEGAIIDQHFSQRRRLARLLAAVARNPRLLGIGVDEDTALVISKGHGFEVLGAGGVTLVDARRLPQPLEGFEPDQLLQLPEMQVHWLPQGASYRLAANAAGERGALVLPEAHRAQPAQPALHELLPMLPQL